jgi:hypothetical protein
MIACSLLERAGHGNVINVAGRLRRVACRRASGSCGATRQGMMRLIIDGFVIVVGTSLVVQCRACSGISRGDRQLVLEVHQRARSRLRGAGDQGWPAGIPERIWRDRSANVAEDRSGKRTFGWRHSRSNSQLLRRCCWFHDGRLHYEDHLADVFSRLSPLMGRRFTIRELLNHTSGLVDYEDIMAKQYAGIPDDKIPQIRDAGVLDLLNRQTGTKFMPGTRWEYSNSGYVVLAMVVEKRSGMRFGDFLRRRIFTPLGMTDTVAHEKGRGEVYTSRLRAHQDNDRMGPDRSEFDFGYLGATAAFIRRSTTLKSGSTHWPITHCSARKKLSRL